MPADPLRERLKRLVEEWRFFTGCREEAERLRLDRCADQLAALLAESEPVDWSQPQDLIITIEGPLPEPAPLKLGHAYCGPEDGSDCKITMDYSPEGKCWLRCGQPREAH